MSTGLDYADVIHYGTHGFNTFGTLPSGFLRSLHVAADAAIAASKLIHQTTHSYSQPNSAMTAETRIIHNVYGATGTLVAFKAGSIVIAIGNAVATVDLKKNGTSILTAVITLDNANTVYVAEAGAIANTSVVAGDTLTIVTTVTPGTGTQQTGFFCSLTMYEDPA